ncbi:nucleolar and coiled-body phosphoprotein 1-like isoform X2 [Clinocottus analis]
MLNTEYLDPPLAPDPDPIDLLSYRELLMELLNVIQQQLADLSAAASGIVTSGPEEAASSRVEEPAPPGSRSDTSPNQDGQRTPPGNTSPSEGWTIGSPVVPSQADTSPSPLDHDDCLFKAHIASQQLFPKTSPAGGMASASEARDAGASAETPGGAKPEEALTSLSDLGDTQSAQASQEGPRPGDPPASESPSAPSVSLADQDPLAAESPSRPSVSGADQDPPAAGSPSRPSVSGADQDPRTAAVEDPASGFGDDFPAGPPAPSVPALTPPRPLPPMREPENMNSNSRPEATPESSNADSCDRPVDVVLSEPASPELKAEQGGETAIKEATQKQTATKAKEGRSTKKIAKRKENADKKTKARRSLRPSSQTENPKAMLRDEPTTEEAEEKKACEKAEKEPERVGVVSQKQKRRSSGRRTLSQDQTPRPEIGERERRRKPEGEKQKLEVKDPDASSGPGAGSALTMEVPQEEREFGEGARMSGITRRTTSATTEEREQPTPPPPAAKARGRGRHPGVEIQDHGTLEGKASEEEAGRRTLTVLSQMRRSRREKTSEDKVGPAEASPQSPKVQTDTRSTKDSTEESSGEEGQRLPDKRKRADVSGIDCLRSQSASRRRANPVEVEAGRRSLAESPRKRPKTSGCEWSPTPTGSSVKAKDGNALKAAGRREGTRRRCRKGRGPCFPTRLSKKLPTKYQDFTLCKVKTRSRTLGKE